MTLGISLALVCALAFVLAACTKTREVRVASTCPDGGCAEKLSCAEAVQLRPDCGPGDADAGACAAASRADDRTACEDCTRRNARLHIASTPLSSCACARCALPLADCLAGSESSPERNPLGDEKCRQLLECSWEHHCSGSECFCGKGGETWCGLFANNGHAPLGPCWQLIAELSGCSGSSALANCVYEQGNLPGSVLYRAGVAERCLSRDTGTAPPPEPTPQCPFSIYGGP